MKKFIGILAVLTVLLGATAASAGSNPLWVDDIGLKAGGNWSIDYSGFSTTTCVDDWHSNCYLYYTTQSSVINASQAADNLFAEFRNNNGTWDYPDSDWYFVQRTDYVDNSIECGRDNWGTGPLWVTWWLKSYYGSEVDNTSYRLKFILEQYVENEAYDDCSGAASMAVPFAMVDYHYYGSGTYYSRQFGVWT